MLLENSPAQADSRVWPEALTLRDHGYQVSIICPASQEYKKAYNCVAGIHMYQYRIPTGTNKYTTYFAEYGVALFMTFLLSVKVLFRHGFDVIHAANPPDIFFVIGIFYRLLGKKYLFDQHDLTPELFQVIFKGRMKLLHRLLLFCEWCSYKTAHLVITTNLSQKHFAITRGHCPPQKVCVVRNGPNLKRLRLMPPEIKLKQGRRYLLAYVGLIAVQDGVEYTLHALHHLVYKRGRQDVSLVIMGDGDQLPALRILAHTLQLDAYVNIAGWTQSEDLVRYLSTADVGLSPDPHNGLNEYCTMVKTMEYMAMARPIVAFDLQETRYTAQDAALYATPNLIEDFADKIETLLENEDLRSRMGASGRKRVEETLSWVHSQKMLLQAYELLFPTSGKTGASPVLDMSW